MRIELPRFRHASACAKSDPHMIRVPVSCDLATVAKFDTMKPTINNVEIRHLHILSNTSVPCVSALMHDGVQKILLYSRQVVCFTAY